jgi:hypothetical protein
MNSVPGSMPVRPAVQRGPRSAPPTSNNYPTLTRKGNGSDVSIHPQPDATKTMFTQTTNGNEGETSRDINPTDNYSPRFLLDLLRPCLTDGDLLETIYQTAVWMTFRGASESIVSNLLTELGLMLGLAQKDLDLQLNWGTAHIFLQMKDLENERAAEGVGPF